MREFLDFPLFLLAASIVWLFYAYLPVSSLPLFLFGIGIGWWIKSHQY